jgi:hypothetical protein
MRDEKRPLRRYKALIQAILAQEPFRHKLPASLMDSCSFGGRPEPLRRPAMVVTAELRNTDVDKVGGKSASLGEMVSQLFDVDVPVPGGFSTAFADQVASTISSARHSLTSPSTLSRRSQVPCLQITTVFSLPRLCSAATVHMLKCMIQSPSSFFM